MPVAVDAGHVIRRSRREPRPIGAFMDTPTEPETPQPTPTASDDLKKALKEATEQIRFNPSRGSAIIAPNIGSLMRNPRAGN
jgi:hypothetical protein